MATGKQAETTVVHWHPGDATGHDGLGNTGITIPAGHFTTENTTASGVQTFFDARIDKLKAKVVASGLLPTYAG